MTSSHSHSHSAASGFHSRSPTTLPLFAQIAHRATPHLTRLARMSQRSEAHKHWRFRISRSRGGARYAAHTYYPPRLTSWRGMASARMSSIRGLRQFVGNISSRAPNTAHPWRPSPISTCAMLGSTASGMSSKAMHDSIMTVLLTGYVWMKSVPVSYSGRATLDRKSTSLRNRVVRARQENHRART